MPFSATSPAVSCGFPVKRDVKNLSSLPRVHSRKKVLSKENVLCQGRINLLSAVPPCFIAGEAMYKPCAMPLCRIPTYPRELTHPNALQNTPDSPFPCTLRGPFDPVFLACFSASQTLCKGIKTVISASTVSQSAVVETHSTGKRQSCQADFIIASSHHL